MALSQCAHNGRQAQPELKATKKWVFKKDLKVEIKIKGKSKISAPLTKTLKMILFGYLVGDSQYVGCSIATREEKRSGFEGLVSFRADV